MNLVAVLLINCVSAALVATKETLGWKPRHAELADIVRTAWNWFSVKAPA